MRLGALLVPFVACSIASAQPTLQPGASTRTPIGPRRLAAADSVLRISVPDRAERTPRIDGKDDDDTWRNGTVITGFRQW